MRSSILIGIAILLMTGAAQAGDWPMFRHDTSHSGTADEVVEPPLKLLWEFTKGGSIYSSPAIAEGMVYVGSEDFNVYALDAATGAIKWEYPTGGVVRSSPAVFDGVVYVGSYDKNVYALDAANGAFKWEYTTGGIVESSPVVSNGIVYVGSSEDGNIYALDAATGALKWKYMAGWHVTSPAVSDGVVYTGSDVNNVYALDAATGALRWKHELENDIGRGVVDSSSPTVSNGMVYVIAQVNSPKAWVYALDATTGALKWKYMTGSYLYSSPAVSDGTVYVGSNDKNVYAFDATTGALRWKYTGSYGFFSPSVSGDVVYVGSEDGNLYALDAVTGALKWKIRVPIVSSPVVSGGSVYVGSYYSDVYAFAAGVDGNEINWITFGGVILAILLIGAIVLLLRRSKESAPKAVEEPALKDKPPQKYKISWIILIILLLVAGSVGYTIYQKYSPLAELASCGNNCIDYKKVIVAQYQTSVPDIKITNANTEKMIMDVPIIIRNPSTKDTETLKIDFDVSMEEKHLTKGTIPAYELPAKRNTTILIKDVVIKYEELGEVLKTVASKHGAEMVTEGKANISMTTDLLIYLPIEVFSINIYTFTIPIQIESEVPVDMLKQNEEIKKQIEEKLPLKVPTAIPTQIPTIIPTAIPTLPSLPTPTATPTLPLPTPTLPKFP